MSTAMTDEELRALVAQVQGDLEGLLKSEHEKLSKAHPGEEDSSEVPADESATADDSGSDGPPSGDSAGGPPAGDSAPPDASAPPAPDASAPPAPDASAPPAGDPMTDPSAVDPAALEAELASMPPDHVTALYMAAKRVLFAQQGAGAGADPMGSAPPAAPGPGPDAGAGAPPVAAAATPPSPSPDAPPALKGEMNPANGGKITAVSKSEKDVQIEALNKKVQEFEGITTALMTVVEKVIKVPPRKAVAGVSELNKSAPDPKSLPKAEVKARLNRAARTQLSKSDRELINQYSVGAIGVEGIKHLLDVK